MIHNTTKAHGCQITIARFLDCTECFFCSVARFGWWLFAKFHRPVGWYSSYLLPMQANGTFQNVIFQTLRQSGKNTLYTPVRSEFPMRYLLDIDCETYIFACRHRMVPWKLFRELWQDRGYPSVLRVSLHSVLAPRLPSGDTIGESFCSWFGLDGSHHCHSTETSPTASCMQHAPCLQAYYLKWQTKIFFRQFNVITMPMKRGTQHICRVTIQVVSTSHWHQNKCSILV